MIEEEAKTKWCPFSRNAGSAAHEPSFNRINGKPDVGSVCIGSACMAWRGKPNKGFEARADRAFRVEGLRLTPEPHEIDGFCGLAGAPQ